MERPPKSTTEIILAAFAAAGEGAELTPADVADWYRDAYGPLPVQEASVRGGMTRMADKKSGPLRRTAYGRYRLQSQRRIARNGNAVVPSETGWEGGAHRPDALPLAPIVPTPNSRSLARRLEESVSVTLYTSVSAGNGTYVFDEEARTSVQLPRLFFRSWLGFDPPAVLGVSEVDGDSMSPILEHGDLVLYELVHDASGGGLYVINYDGKMLCKRVQRIGRAYRLIPENRVANYVPETVQVTDEGYQVKETGDLITFGIVGRVMWPNPTVARLHIQQVGDLLRQAFREAVPAMD